MVLLLNQDALGRIALVFVIKGACLTGMDDGVVFWSVGKVRGHEILAKRSKVNGLQFPVRNALFKDGGFGASRLHSTAQWSDKTIWDWLTSDYFTNTSCYNKFQSMIMDMTGCRSMLLGGHRIQERASGLLELSAWMLKSPVIRSSLMDKMTDSK